MSVIFLHPGNWIAIRCEHPFRFAIPSSVNSWFSLAATHVSRNGSTGSLAGSPIQLSLPSIRTMPPMDSMYFAAMRSGSATAPGFSSTAGGAFVNLATSTFFPLSSKLTSSPKAVKPPFLTSTLCVPVFTRISAVCRPLSHATVTFSPSTNTSESSASSVSSMVPSLVFTLNAPPAQRASRPRPKRPAAMPAKTAGFQRRPFAAALRLGEYLSGSGVASSSASSSSTSDTFTISGIGIGAAMIAERAGLEVAGAKY